jgi:hypothetical protein
MKKKIIGIFVCIIVMTTAFSISTAIIDTATATITKPQQYDIVIMWINGGFGITAGIKNTDETNPITVVCTITLSGMVLPKIKSKTYTIGPGITQHMPMHVIGLGPITITVTAASSAFTTKAKVFGFFVKVA